MANIKDHMTDQELEELYGETRATCSTAGPLQVTVKDGKMVRVEPMEFDPEDVDSWECEVNGKVYKPPLTHPLLPWGMIGKQMAYSENRVKYPMKRVDWDPDAPADQRNTQNRGVSGYERISWDEAFDIIHKEIVRIIDTYGNESLSEFYSAHPEWGSVHYFFSDWVRFWDMMNATHIDFSPNSWEGWAAGATGMWGFWSSQGIPPAEDTLFDISEHDDLIILWGNDPMFHNLYGGVDQARLWRWWKELGKEVVLIEPLYNETALAYADRWLGVYPGTDGALACAIAYQWIVDGTYEKEYLDTHTIGFDEDTMPEGVPQELNFKNYILGGLDDTPKTPEWAAERCGIAARTIRKLAREWASKPTSLWAFCGGACRRQHSDTFTRVIATLAMMRGMGQPGSNVIGPFLSLCGPYDKTNQIGPLGYADGGMNGVIPYYSLNENKQHLTFQKLLEAVEEGRLDYYGGDLFTTSEDEYFNPRSYPADGNGQEIHLFWQRGSSCTNPPERLRHLKFLRSPKLEAVFVSAPWFDRDCRMADLVLPATTMYEREDLTEPACCGQYIPPAYVGLRSAIYHQRCIQPVGESKTDMEIMAEVSERLGLLDWYIGDYTEQKLIQGIYDRTNIGISYDELREKGYYVWPAPKNYKEYQDHKQFHGFYEDPENNPVGSRSGKVEIFSTMFWEHYGNNPLIPPIPEYIPEEEGHETTGELKEKYPLQQLMAHPKFRFHGKYNDCAWLTDVYKIIGPDGYKYEPAMVNPADAEPRGLKDGDIIEAFNDRGSVLAGVVVTHRVRPGVVQLSYGAWNDPLDGGLDPTVPDRGGDGALLMFSGEMSPHHLSGAYNSNLIEIRKVDLDELAEKYPVGWAGKYRSWNKTDLDVPELDIDGKPIA